MAGWLASGRVLLTWQQPNAWEYDYKSVTHPRALRWFSCCSNAAAVAAAAAS